VRTALALALLALPACRAAPFELPDAATSPQAKAEPTPLTTLSSIASAAAPGAASNSGPTPEPLLPGTELAADLAHEVLHETSGRDPKELIGYALHAVLRTGEGPGAPKAPEVNSTAIEAARRKTESHLTIDVSQTRARFVLSSGFVLPPGTELRARLDRYGHLLLWPGEATYRIVQPGALRALLGERRLDVAPLSAVEIRSVGEGSRRIGMRTRRIEVATRAAKATMEVATLRDAGDGGVLVCRMLLDLMSGAQSPQACGADDVPLHAEIRWTTRGALTFDVSTLARRADLAAQDLAAPPASVTFMNARPPAIPADTLIHKSEIGTFRTTGVDTPPAAARDAQVPPPENGLLLVNSSDELRVVWLDGALVAWVAPGERLALPTLQRGRYALQWRTFLGDSWEPADLIVVPGTSEVR
jgi:hypothetical protein